LSCHFWPGCFCARNSPWWFLSSFHCKWPLSNCLVQGLSVVSDLEAQSMKAWVKYIRRVEMLQVYIETECMFTDCRYSVRSPTKVPPSWVTQEPWQGIACNYQLRQSLPWLSTRAGWPPGLIHCKHCEPVSEQLMQDGPLCLGNQVLRFLIVIVGVDYWMGVTFSPTFQSAILVKNHSTLLAGYIHK
jgi:hypothetical protein